MKLMVREVAELKLLSGLPPLLSRLYASRGLTDVQQLDLSLKQLPAYSLLKGIESAVALLIEAIQRRQHILILGDFDADGATSTSLACLALKKLGAAQVSYLVPNRFEYGYGLTPEIVELALTMKPDLLVTVDNGIASLAGVAAAKAAGLKVLITDHHLPGHELPAADAIVNPNQPGCGFPSKALAGVGVIFYVMLALRAGLREQGAFELQPEPNLAELLDLVALGTVADVVPLDHLNRILVRQGLLRIRSNRCRPGIRALLQVAKRSAANLAAIDLGFVVGPRLNAAGRLDDMSLGIECLLTEQDSAALQIAVELDALNRERREIEQGMKQEALAFVESIQLAGDLPAGLCLYHPDWHQGVIGIVAGRIKELYHRPVIALARVNEGELKGSARSIPGLHLRDLLDRIATLKPGLLTKFGGHAMAAGLSLPEAHFEEFAATFAQQAALCLDAEALSRKLWTDGELSSAEMTLDMAQYLREAGPWGQSFPEPVFQGRFQILEQKLMAEKHLKLRVEQQGVSFEAVAFNVDLTQWPNSDRQVLLAYRLDVNEFRGSSRLQLQIDYLGRLT